MKTHPVAAIVALLAFAACDSTEPAETHDIEVDVICDGCQTSAANDNLRLTLYPASAVMGGEINAGTLIDARNYQIEGTGPITLTAFTNIEVGDYVISAATPYPIELGGACRTAAADTVAPKAGRGRRPFPARYPYIWPIVHVRVPNTPRTNPVVYLNC